MASDRDAERIHNAELLAKLIALEARCERMRDVLSRYAPFGSQAKLVLDSPLDLELLDRLKDELKELYNVACLDSQGASAELMSRTLELIRNSIDVLLKSLTGH